MSRTSSGKVSKLNLPLIALWVASVAIAVAGSLLVTTSNAKQAALYTAQNGDYAQLFAAQSGSTLGGLLIAVGVLGVLLALAAQVITRQKPAAPEAAAVSDEELGFDADLYVDESADDATTPQPAEPSTEETAAGERDEKREPAATH